MPGTPSDRVAYGINVQATQSTSHRSRMNAQESPEGNIARGCSDNIAGRASGSAMTSLSVVVQAALRRPVPVPTGFANSAPTPALEELDLRYSFTPLPFTFPEPSKFTFNLLNYPRQIYSEPKTAVSKVSDIYFSFTPRGSHLLLIYSTP